jgi:hypothetical protein
MSNIAALKHSRNARKPGRQANRNAHLARSRPPSRRGSRVQVGARRRREAPAAPSGPPALWRIGLRGPRRECSGHGSEPLAARATHGAARKPAGDELEPRRPQPEADDLADYLEATRRWDPAQFTTAVDIVLGAYGNDADG